MYLVADLDGDGTRDAVAWTSSSDPLAGRLLFYKGAPGGAAPAQPRQLAVLASGAIGGPACAAEPALEQIGPATVAVSLHAACAPVSHGQESSAGLRWPCLRASPRYAQELWLGEPAVGERLIVELDGSDVDGDQRDDLVARISIEGAPPPFEPGPARERRSAVVGSTDRSVARSRRARGIAAQRCSRRARSRDEESRCAAGHRGRAADRSPLRVALLRRGRSARGRCRAEASVVDRAARSKMRHRPAFARRSPSAMCLARSPLTSDMGWRPVTTTKQRRAELEKALLKAAPAHVPSVTKVFATVPDLDASAAPALGPAHVHARGRSPGSHQERARHGERRNRCRRRGARDPELAGRSDEPRRFACVDRSRRFLRRNRAADSCREKRTLSARPIVPPSAQSAAFPARSAVRLDPVPVAWGRPGPRSVDGRQPDSGVARSDAS